MSQENVELVRRSFESLNSVIGTGELQSFLDEFLDPDIDWRAVEGEIDDVGGMRGLAAVRRYIEDWLDTFDDMTVTPEEIIAYAIRDGRFVKVREYYTKADALEAVGLSE